VRQVPLDRVSPCAFQPRKDFPPEALQELADSIREQGILQPLIVRERGGAWEIIAGERRWRAARLAGLQRVPVIIRQAGDREVIELALVENLQRENLNPIEEARGYAQLMEQFGLTQEEAATKVGRSRSVVANALRLLRLAAPVQAALREGRLSVGHAKVILGLPGEAQQQAAVERILAGGLNVRQTEVLVAAAQSPVRETRESAAAGFPAPRDPHVTGLEARRRERLGTKVRLRYSEGKGVFEVSFFSDAELERLLQILGVTVD